ncbi:hypothetical protein [Capnocytophaga catalasegens]|uniref:Transcriptional regulator n=1 Tax=Capnocytophaga catalasegens TaxID=1004260 RepID=A0AAV5AU99_9FLAO|nr:hypothetical protein [Capnocytophaga catalasegens]GIZ15061.1 hypothetical protein RCZ03_10610 [Capnocytophaga catalasegens]GJM49441.1 hypothetical protein RCZ15_04160 [Capnocytophaga catalasegens]GJM52591.1 hypothetical protein RCZ16_09080 [Capnocytophaga catalasegens]
MKSKFNLGERVYFLDKNKVTTGVILEIKIIAREIDLQSRLISYRVGEPHSFLQTRKEEELYTSKEALLNDIKQQINEL